MLDVVFLQLRGYVRAKKAEAADLRRRSHTNPIADTIDYDAAELESLVKKLEQETELLTPAQFAKIHRTTPQTVVNWIHSGKIKATARGRGWLISRSQLPPKIGERRREKKSA